MAPDEAEVTFAKGLEDVIVAKSRITYIDGEIGRLVYLGIPIEEMAKHSTFEETAYLLGHGALPTRQQLDEYSRTLVANRTLPDALLNMMKLFPPTALPMDVLRTAVSALGMLDPNPKDTSKEANLLRSARLIAQFPSIVAAFARIRQGLAPVAPRPDLNHAANFLYMLSGQVPDEFTARVMDVALVLHADHEMNASTFASLVTGSTLSDMYSAITTGVGTLKGPLHGGANEAVVAMLQEIGTVENAEPYVLNALKTKKKIMGFGHRVYHAYDPRARIFKEYARELSQRKNDMTWFQIGEKIEEVMIREVGRKGIFPNVDFYSGIVYHHLGIPTDLYTPIFAIARVAGWTAHVMEYWEDNRIFRPASIYTGPKEAPYVPIDQR